MRSDKPTAILKFLREYPHSYLPTVRKIGVAQLEAQGLIDRKPGCPRCIKVV